MNKPKLKTQGQATTIEDDPYTAQGKLDYLRGPAGERDRVTIWKAGRGLLPGTVEGGLREGWVQK